MTRQHRHVSTLSLAGITLAAITGFLIGGRGMEPARTEAQETCAVSRDQLLAHWTFDEGTGTTATDTSGHGHTGLLRKDTAWTTQTPAAVSPNVAALSFDGDDYVDILNSDDLQFGNQSFTVSVFVNARGGEGVMATTKDNVTPDWGIGVARENVLVFAYGERYWTHGPEGRIEEAYAAPAMDGNWHHLAAVFTRDGASLTADTYFDGFHIGSRTADVGNSIASGVPLILGGQRAEEFLVGLLDDVRIYGRALSREEVEALARGCGDAAEGAASVSLTAEALQSQSSVVAAAISSAALSVSTAPAAPASAPTVTSAAENIASAPLCNGEAATIYVQDGIVVGGPNAGQPFSGVLQGTAGHDVIVGTVKSDVLLGGAGDDVLCGLTGNDHLDGHTGRDTLYGGMGADVLQGGTHDDRLYGGSGGDFLDGEQESDLLCGQSGNDFFSGDPIDGADGGTGMNMFCTDGPAPSCAPPPATDGCDDAPVVR